MDDHREMPGPEAAALDALRLAARAAYTLERHPVSLRELGHREAFAGLSYRQLYGWYQEEGWAEERRLNLAAWRREGEEERRERAQSRREREAQGLQRLLAEATWLRRQPTVRPKSWEAVAQVHIKTIEMFRQWDKEEREETARQEELALARQGAAGADSPLGDISQEETFRVAHFLLQQRLDVARQEAQDSRTDAPPGPRKAAGAEG